MFVRLRQSGVKAVLDVLHQILDQELESASDQTFALLLETSCQLLEQFRQDPWSAEGYEMLKRLSPRQASTLFDAMMRGTFPDGNPDDESLTEPAIILLAGLMSASGAHANALGFLDALIARQDRQSLRYARWFAQCRAIGCSDRISDYWPTMPDVTGSPDELAAALKDEPLDIGTRRAFVRALAEKRIALGALDELSIGLSLPVDEHAKMGLAQDLAVLASFLLAQGDNTLLAKQRLHWGLAAYPAVAKEAADYFDATVQVGKLPFLDEATASRIRSFFLVSAGYAATVAVPTGRQLSPYPTKNGKPHVDTVWLEITNFCNQKCGFCPDPFREEARNWLPLDQVKGLIDDLAENVSVGSMQLNAYGEPLLHPHIGEILQYIKDRKLPWPTFFTTHGLTLVEKKLKQLSNNYPNGIAVSLHNDSQESYAATRSAKIGDYETLVSRVTDLLRQMVSEQASSHLRLYQMVCNGYEAKEVDAKVRQAFPDSPERMLKHIRSWERIAADIVLKLPAEVRAEAIVNSEARIETAFRVKLHDERNYVPILRWKAKSGELHEAFISTRPVGTYANLLLEYDPRWKVKREVVNKYTCGFTKTPSLAIFASGRLGVCCLDLNSTATFGSLSDFANLKEALTSPAAMRMFAELANGVATNRGCQICLASGSQLCNVG
jgi:wyosine [tRNA(Phe)-imidazoG37] synthetase (radical SAM superfamily)